MMVSVLMLAATAAHAEHKLLVTDVLDFRQVEAQATLQYFRSQDSFDSVNVSGRSVRNITESRYSVGAGLGHGLEVRASIPYVHSDNMKFEFKGSTIPSAYDNASGYGDLTLGAKYALIPERQGPVALTAGLDLKLDSARRRDAGTGTTDVSPFLAASKDIGYHTIPYASYRMVFHNHDNGDQHILTLGAEKQFNEVFTLGANLSANFAVASSRFSSTESYSAGVGSYIQIAHNLYVTPALSAGFGSPAHSKGSTFKNGSPFAASGSISLYFFYK
jgi:hypothetical protein